MFSFISLFLVLILSIIASKCLESGQSQFTASLRPEMLFWIDPVSGVQPPSFVPVVKQLLIAYHPPTELMAPLLILSNNTSPLQLLHSCSGFSFQTVSSDCKPLKGRRFSFSPWLRARYTSSIQHTQRH